MWCADCLHLLSRQGIVTFSIRLCLCALLHASDFVFVWPDKNTNTENRRSPTKYPKCKIVNAPRIPSKPRNRMGNSDDEDYDDDGEDDGDDDDDDDGGGGGR